MQPAPTARPHARVLARFLALLVLLGVAAAVPLTLAPLAWAGIPAHLDHAPPPRAGYLLDAGVGIAVSVGA